MLPQNLAMLRNLNGFSQEEIAEKIGISRQAYAKWEKGETLPDVEKCAKLAKVYGTTIDTLINFEPHQEGMIIPPAPTGKHIFGSVTLNERGQIVIPKAARDIFHLKPGDRLILLGEDGEGLALVKAELFEDRIRHTMETAKNVNI